MLIHHLLAAQTNTAIHKRNQWEPLSCRGSFCFWLSGSLGSPLCRQHLIVKRRADDFHKIYFLFLKHSAVVEKVKFNWCGVACILCLFLQYKKLCLLVQRSRFGDLLLSLTGISGSWMAVEGLQLLRVTNNSKAARKTVYLGNRAMVALRLSSQASNPVAWIIACVHSKPTVGTLNSIHY